MRKYLALTDDGHDHGEFIFYSSHRANSKANLEDAKDTLRKQYGSTAARTRKIISTERAGD